MKIICIGRNYTEHAKELNNPVPSNPVFFMKPDTALIQNHNPFFYPEFSKDIHFETELVLKICKSGRHVEEKFAHKYYDQIGIGLDLTARDLQSNCKKKGLPWEIAKAFDNSAPLGKFLPVSEFKNINDINFSLEVNGELRQKGNSGDMIFSFDTIIAYITQFVTIKVGDLIFTGTPAGVGPIKINDHFDAFIEDKQLLSLNVK